MLNTQLLTMTKSNFLLFSLIAVLVGTSFNASLMAQSEQGILVGLINYEKALPKSNSVLEADFFATLYQGNLGNTNKKENQKIKSVTDIEANMSADFGAFIIDLIQSSHPSVNWKSIGSVNCVDISNNSILCDEYIPLISWLESEKSFVKIYTESNQSVSTGMLYGYDASNINDISTIEMNK
jgi:hypothetical protein